ncbi:MAG: glycosyltransferase family 2 protein [Candidatus Magasanikbacteria bacterium]|nr:glycosyltransferase family 2 protein [Candidatus Magasanikbacteria bacterium]
MLVAIVPAYNEEKNIGPVISGLFNHADKVVVVDDGSVDNTVLEAEEALRQAQGKAGVVLRHKINRGQGAALQTGHEYALKLGADYVIDFDADGQFDVMDIKPALEALQASGADILFGSRFLDNRSRVPRLKRMILLPLARLFDRVFFGINLTDAHNGFRILNKRALSLINITQDRMAHASEIPAQAKKFGLKQIEFPVKVVYREYGQGWGGGLRVVRDLVLGRFVGGGK